ncbi:MAG: LytTR family transcriptional regulator [Saprospiraceae bacterium]|nr:LytTR family transcriptional regulator [Saprospiraceae bacterium]
MPFFRIHNSYIINIDHLKGVIAKEGYFAELSNGVKLKISRRRKDDFIQFIDIA